MPNNRQFDTTKGNTQHNQGLPVDFPCAESMSAEPLSFKGNMDIEKFEQFVAEHGADKISLVLMTITNNSVGGQPVSMKNIKEVSEICNRYKLPFFIDSARFAENCFFIKKNEAGYAQKPIKEIAQELFELCDGVLMSAKKDGLANSGGVLAVNH